MTLAFFFVVYDLSALQPLALLIWLARRTARLAHEQAAPPIRFGPDTMASMS